MQALTLLAAGTITSGLSRRSLCGRGCWRAARGRTPRRRDHQLRARPHRSPGPAPGRSVRSAASEVSRHAPRHSPGPGTRSPAAVSRSCRRRARAGPPASRWPRTRRSAPGLLGHVGGHGRGLVSRDGLRRCCRDVGPADRGNVADPGLVHVVHHAQRRGVATSAPAIAARTMPTMPTRNECSATLSGCGMPRSSQPARGGSSGTPSRTGTSRSRPAGAPPRPARAGSPGRGRRRRSRPGCAHSPRPSFRIASARSARPRRRTWPARGRTGAGRRAPARR